MKKNNIIYLLLFLIPVCSFSQEVITGLSSNAALQHADWKSIYAKSKSSTNGMLTIPFVDDFSKPGVYPDQALWADKFVFINTSYPYKSITAGVATFDALNDIGELYPEAGFSEFGADTLTSNAIRLDSFYLYEYITDVNTEITEKRIKDTLSLQLKDSLYFSFYYQPQGIGNAPDKEDSLALEFYSPKTGEWNHIWSTVGMTLQEFHAKYNVWFKQVMIPITDSATYYQQGFKFRFHNYASLTNNSLPGWAGNVDQWNIDYISLDKDRNMADSVYHDIAFAEPASSILKNYYAMPWSQFTNDELKDTLYNYITNLDSINYNSIYSDTIQQIGGTYTDGYYGGSANIYPYATNGYQTNLSHAKAPVKFILPAVSSDSVVFRITHVVTEGATGDSLRSNDTTAFDQKFYNYYAYDDGTAEAGYGLVPINSMLAYKFTLNHPDTLRAIDMFFNRTLNNANQQYFYLTVWNDANGYPNEVIYEKTGARPEFEDSLNKFHTYRIDDETIVLSGTFYIGWRQLSDVSLNIGYDKSSDQHANIFFKTGNSWENSINKGALMIRPLLGKEIPIVAAIEEHQLTNRIVPVYPNPSKGDNISIVLPADLQIEESLITLKFYDMLGNNIYNCQYTEQINIAALKNGVYLMHIVSDNHKTGYYSKLTIVK